MAARRYQTQRSDYQAQNPELGAARRFRADNPQRYSQMVAAQQQRESNKKNFLDFLGLGILNGMFSGSPLNVLTTGPNTMTQGPTWQFKPPWADQSGGFLDQYRMSWQDVPEEPRGPIDYSTGRHAARERRQVQRMKAINANRQAYLNGVLPPPPEVYYDDGYYGGGYGGYGGYGGGGGGGGYGGSGRSYLPSAYERYNYGKATEQAQDTWGGSQSLTLWNI